MIMDIGWDGMMSAAPDNPSLDRIFFSSIFASVMPVDDYDR
jgi:hypothetical protein